MSTERRVATFGFVRSLKVSSFILAFAITFLGSSNCLLGNAAYAETSAAPSKNTKIEKLYELSGAKERINAALQIGAIMQSQEFQGAVKKKLLELKRPEAQAQQIAQQKADLFKAKMKERIAPLVKEAYSTYATYTDANVTEPDIDFLLEYYSSDVVKSFEGKSKSLSEGITKPLLEEITSFLKTAQTELQAGKPEPKFPVPDYSKEMSAIEESKRGVIRSVIALSFVVDNIADFFKESFDSLVENSGSEAEKKLRHKMLSGIPYKTLVRPLVIIAYDKNFSEEDLTDIDSYLSDPRMAAAKPHITKAEQGIMETVLPKYDKLAEVTTKEVTADLMSKSTPAAAAKPGAKPAVKAKAAVKK